MNAFQNLPTFQCLRASDVDQQRGQFLTVTSTQCLALKCETRQNAAMKIVSQNNNSYFWIVGIYQPYLSAPCLVFDEFEQLLSRLHEHF